MDSQDILRDAEDQAAKLHATRVKFLNAAVAWPKAAFDDPGVTIVFNYEQAVRSFGIVPKNELGVRLDKMIVAWLDTVDEAREFFK